MAGEGVGSHAEIASCEGLQFFALPLPGVDFAHKGILACDRWSSTCVFVQAGFFFFLFFFDCTVILKLTFTL